MDKIEIRDSPASSITILILSLIMTLGGVLMLTVHSAYTPARWVWLLGASNAEFFSYVVAWSTIVFFGLCTLIGIRQLADTKPRIIIDDNGVFDSMFGLIPWQEIEGVYITWVGQQARYRARYVCLQLKNHAKYYSITKSPWVRRIIALGGLKPGSLPLNIGLYPADKLCQLINDKLTEPQNKKPTKG